MQKMSDQLEQASKDKQALEQKLQQAGMSKEQAAKAAADPEAMKKALEQLFMEGELMVTARDGFEKTYDLT